MNIVISLFILFLLIASLVGVYHLFLWNETPLLSPSRSWLSGFECGFTPVGTSECYFSYTYFILLVFFVVFDLEISLLLNVPFSFSFFKNCLYYLSFLVVLGLGYGAELYSGYVRWSY